LSLVRSLRLSRSLMFVLSGALDSFWSSGRVIRTMTTRGYWRLRWETQHKLFRIFTVPCLGRQEPEGGVVLGFDTISLYIYIYLIM
jgi:hypothetical protein